MPWSDKWGRATGYLLILLAACLVLGIATSFGVTDQDPTNRDDVQQFLVDVDDNAGYAILTMVMFVLTEGVVAILLTPLLYLMFRDRSRALALIFLAGLLVSSATGLMNDALVAAMIPLSDSYVNGGAGLDAGDPMFLDIAHALMWTASLVSLTSFTTLGIGMMALGALIYASPEGEVNPPRVLGVAAIVAGLTALLAWAIVATDVGYLFFALQGIFSVIFLIGTGAHLIMRSGKGSSAAAA